MEVIPPSSLASACLKGLAYVLVRTAFHGELIMSVSGGVLFCFLFFGFFFRRGFSV